MLLFRHAECNQDYENDPFLTEQGIKQIEGYLQYFRESDIRSVFFSPKRRCIQTTQIILKALGKCNSQCFDILREIHPDTLFEKPPFISEDYLRANNVYKTLVVPFLYKQDILIVSHQNLLLFILKKIDKLISSNPFEKYCSGVILKLDEEEKIKWKPLLIC